MLGRSPSQWLDPLAQIDDHSRPCVANRAFGVVRAADVAAIFYTAAARKGSLWVPRMSSIDPGSVHPLQRSPSV